MTLPVTFGLSSSSAQTNAPFTFGHIFAKGDVPSGQYVDSGLADWQAVPTTFWSDGSVRHAIISGRVNTSVGTTNISISASSTPRTGVALTETDLSSAAPSIVLTCGAETINFNSLIGTSAKHRTVCSGPVMSNWIYRAPVPNSTQLVAWFDVRLYKGGAVEVFPWIENGFLLVSGGSNDVRTWTLTIGGATKFTQSLDIKGRTRIPLVTGSVFSYWSVTDPAILPKHSGAYLKSTTMVPNLAYTPTESALAALTTTYTPNTLADVSPDMGGTGFGAFIGMIPNWDACYVITGDPRAYKASIVNGLASGSWHVHYRDSSNIGGTVYNDFFAMSDYPTISTTWGGTPQVPSFLGGVNSSGGTSAAPERAHQPAFGYVPWLITGRWFFLDEMQSWVTWNILDTNYERREGASNIWAFSQVRAEAWSLRSHMYLLLCLPTTHRSYASLKASWEANISFHYDRTISGLRDSGKWVNNLGWLQAYFGGSPTPYTSLYFNDPSNGVTPGGYWWDAPWQQMMYTIVLATAWNTELDQSAGSKTKHKAVRDFSFKVPVGLAGDGVSGAFNYRRFAEFQLPISSDDIVPENAWLPNYNSVYSVVESNGATGTTALQPLPAGTNIFYGDSAVTVDMWNFHSSLIFGKAALALAVEGGHPGALEAYNRVTSASNYSTSAYASIPMWGYEPRSTVAPSVTSLTIQNSSQAETSSVTQITATNPVTGRHSTRVDSTRLISGATVVGSRGLGVFGSSVPSVGSSGPGFVYNDLNLPADANKEVRGVIETWPAKGTLQVNEDSSFIFTAPDGIYNFTYRLYVDGVDLSTSTVTLNVGSISTLQVISSTQSSSSSVANVIVNASLTVQNSVESTTSTAAKVTPTAGLTILDSAQSTVSVGVQVGVKSNLTIANSSQSSIALPVNVIVNASLTIANSVQSSFSQNVSINADAMLNTFTSFQSSSSSNVSVGVNMPLTIANSSQNSVSSIAHVSVNANLNVVESNQYNLSLPVNVNVNASLSAASCSQSSNSSAAYVSIESVLLTVAKSIQSSAGSTVKIAVDAVLKVADSVQSQTSMNVLMRIYDESHALPDLILTVSADNFTLTVPEEVWIIMTDIINVDSTKKKPISKDPDSRLLYTFDWSAYLASDSDILSSVSFMAPRLSVETQGLTQTTASVWISGGFLGEIASLTCRITTLSGRTDDRTVYFKIEHR